MQIVNLYRYVRSDGGLTVSPVEPDCGYTPMYRIIADDGKGLTQDGVERTVCADVDSTDGWYEVEAVELETLTEEKAEAYDILMGVSD